MLVSSTEEKTRIITNAKLAYKRTNKIKRVVEQVLHDISFKDSQRDLEIRNLREELRSTQRELDIHKKSGGLILPW